MKTIPVLAMGVAVMAGLAAVQGASATEAQGAVRITAAPVDGTGLGMASGVPQHARNSNQREYIGCSVLRGAVITPEGVAPPELPGPNQVVRCSARNAAQLTVACSTTDPHVVDLIASALASVTKDSRLSFFFDAGGVCTHVEAAMHSQLLKAQ